MRVFITGTPGSGKSSLAAAIGDRYQLPVFNIGVQAKVQGLVEEHDDQDDADVIAEESVERIVKKIEKTHSEYVIEGHMSHFAKLRKDAIMICATCPIEILKERLEERGYSEQKVRDNLDSEIFEVCRTEALELGWMPLLYDSSTQDAGEFARNLEPSL